MKRSWKTKTLAAILAMLFAVTGICPDSSIFARAIDNSKVEVSTTDAINKVESDEPLTFDELSELPEEVAGAAYEYVGEDTLEPDGYNPDDIEVIYYENPEETEATEESTELTEETEETTETTAVEETEETTTSETTVVEETEETTTSETTVVEETKETTTSETTVVEETEETTTETTVVEETETSEATETVASEVEEIKEDTEDKEARIPSRISFEEDNDPEIRTENIVGWTFDFYYVVSPGEDKYNLITKKDFNLKYQIQFDSKRIIKAEEVLIKVPSILADYRNGMPIKIDDIGVPQCKKTTDVDGNVKYTFSESDTTPFNYYKEVIDGVEYLCFINYRTIDAGYSTGIQVLYKNLHVMDIADGTSWELRAEIEVKNFDEDGNIQYIELLSAEQNRPLTGIVDTSSSITSLTKRTYKEPGVVYTPGLYTLKQVNDYLPADKYQIPDEYLNSDGTLNTSKYIYELWEVSNTYSANQLCDIYMKETPYIEYEKDDVIYKANGSVVGVRVVGRDETTGYYRYSYVNPNEATKIDEYGFKVADNYSIGDPYYINNLYNFSLNYYVVCAYPVELYNGSNKINLDDELRDEDDIVVIRNDVDSTVVSVDGVDKPSQKSVKGAAGDYRILPPPGGDGFYNIKYSSDRKDLYGWLDTFGTSSDPITYSIHTSNRNYYQTHTNIEHRDYETYTGGFIENVVADDTLLIDLYKETNLVSGEYKPRMLTKDDYYFSAISITARDRGYDPYEMVATDSATTVEELNESTAPNKPTDRDWHIFVMDKDSDEWHEIDSIPFTTGEVTYKLNCDTPEHAEIYRVKVVHNSIDYTSECRINLTVQLKKTSPAIKAFKQLISDKEATELSADERYNIRLINYDLVTMKFKSGSYENPVLKQGDRYSWYKDNGNSRFIADTNNDGIDEHEIQYEAPGSSEITTKGLDDLTKELYGEYISHDSVNNNPYESISRAKNYYVLRAVDKYAHAEKTVTTKNDPVNSRQYMTYTLTAYEGYKVYNSKIIDELQDGESDLTTPNRKQVVIYDLLPYKVQYDGNKTPTVGRITDLYNRTDSSRWDLDVKLIDTEIINNYRNTGRTMIIFTLEYQGAESSNYYVDPIVGKNNGTGNMWFSGFGVEFTTYARWSDLGDASKKPNIMAYTPFDGEYDEVIGKDSQVAEDNGNAPGVSGEDPLDEIFEDIGAGGGDLDNNPNNKNHRRILYGTIENLDDYAISAMSGIKKEVKADDDRTGVYSATANVGFDKGYTYKVTVLNSSADQDALPGNIVVFDRLENAQIDRKDELSDKIVQSGLGETIWKGKLVSVNTKTMEANNICPVVYYGSSYVMSHPESFPNNNVPGMEGEISGFKKANFDELLTMSNGWYTEEQWIANFGSDFSDCVAVAVDARLQYKLNDDGLKLDTEGNILSDGGTPALVEYRIPAMSSISFEINMKSPEQADIEALAAEAHKEVQYTYNNPYYYQTVGKEGHETVSRYWAGDSSRVSIGETEKIEITKNFADGYEIPSDRTGELFSFLVQEQLGKIDSDSISYAPYANKQYRIYNIKKLSDGSVEYVEFEAGIYHATDDKGILKIKAGQMAVFDDVRHSKDYIVTELDNPYWEQLNAQVKEGHGFETLEKVIFDAEDNPTWLETYDSDGNLLYRRPVGNEIIPVVGDEEKVSIRIFENKFRPMVYFKKTAIGIPSDAEKADTEFEFVVEKMNTSGSFEPITEPIEYWIVDKALTNGSIPTKLEDKLSDTEIIRLKANQIAAIFPGEVGDKIRIVEKTTGTVYENDWIVEKPVTKEVTLAEKPESISIENIYKWKNLDITKNITHMAKAQIDELNKESSDLYCPFSFQIFKVEGGVISSTPETGLNWKLLEMDGTEILSETIGSDGIIKAPCANRIIHVIGLEAEATYIVKEVNVSDDFRAENNGEVTVVMPKKTATERIEMTNDYLVRSMKITKIVAANSIPTTGFTLYLQKYNSTKSKYEPCAGYKFTSSKSDRLESLETNSDGSFVIYANEKILFNAIGKQDDQFQICERIDDTYKPLSFKFTDGNENSDWSNISLGYEDMDFTVINGDDNYLVLRKEYEAGDELSEAYLNNSDNKIDKTPVSYKFEINTGSGYTVPSIEADDIARYDSEGYKTPVTDAGDISINRGDTVVININKLMGSSSAANYKITETIPDSIKNFKDKVEVGDKKVDSIFEVNQKTNIPAYVGAAMKDKQALIVNEITGFKSTKSIYKRVVNEKLFDTNVPEGSKLVWKVERFNKASGTWVAAEGVRYTTFNSYDEMTSGIETTGNDGLIVFYKEFAEVANTKYELFASFEDDVKLNYVADSSTEDGTLRVVEVMGEGFTSEEWGTLISYDRHENDWYSDTIPANADTFINTNEYEEVIVEKQMENSKNKKFTFTISEVLGDNILPGSGLFYEIYQKTEETQSESSAYEKTGEFSKYVSNGKTNSNGIFQIEAGQMAVIRVPKSSKMQVVEKIDGNFELTEVTSNKSDTEITNGMRWGTAGLEKKEILDGNPVTIIYAKNGQVAFAEIPDRTKVDANGSYLIEMNGKFAKDPIDFKKNPTASDGLVLTNISDRSWNTGVSTSTSGTRVFNLETGKEVELVSGNVEIPRYILTYDASTRQYYKNEVIGIHQNAYGKYSNSVNTNDVYKNKNNEAYNLLSGLIMPDSIESIGANAFNQCAMAPNFDTFYVSKGLKYLGDSALAFGGDTYLPANGNGTFIMNCSEDGLIGAKNPFGLSWQLVTFKNLVIGDGFTSIKSEKRDNVYADTNPTKAFDMLWVKNAKVENSISTIIYNNDIKSIGTKSFYDRTKLLNVLPYSYEHFTYEYDFMGRVTSKSKTNYAFYDTDTHQLNFKDINSDGWDKSIIVSGPSSVGVSAFQSCGATENLVLDCSVTSVFDSAFVNTMFTGTLYVGHGFKKIVKAAGTRDYYLEPYDNNGQPMYNAIGQSPYAVKITETYAKDDEKGYIVSNIVVDSASAYKDKVNIPTEIGSNVLSLENVFSNCVPISETNATKTRGFTRVVIDGNNVVTDSSLRTQNCSKCNCALFDDEYNHTDTFVDIGENAFANFKRLNEVVLGTSVRQLGNDVANQEAGDTAGAFVTATNNTNLINKVVLSEGLEVIGKASFRHCFGSAAASPKSPTGVSIPSTVQIVGRNAFQDCSNITEFEFRGALTGESKLHTIHGFSMSRWNLGEDTSGKLKPEYATNGYDLVFPASLRRVGSAVIKNNGAYNTKVNLIFLSKERIKYTSCNASNYGMVTDDASVNKLVLKLYYFTESDVFENKGPTTIPEVIKFYVATDKPMDPTQTNYDITTWSGYDSLSDSLKYQDEP